MMKETHCGYVAMVGRPNVGKSTLLNKILGQKLSIVSPKPQTTRQQILGINTLGNVQTIYVDTPGLHQEAQRAMNRLMNRAAGKALVGVNAIIFIVEALIWKRDDEWILKKLTDIAPPVICVVNKIDKVKDKSLLLPYIENLKTKYSFSDIIPISASEGTQVPHLEEIINRYMPRGPFIFPPDQVTDRSQRFLAAEIIREKLLYRMQQEIPYSLTVEIEQFEMKEQVLHLSAIIWVEKETQKKIVIGAKGENLKKVGTEARIELEKILEAKIFLRLWVKVKENWADDDRALKSLGY